jgi:hypothetical protein
MGIDEFIPRNGYSGSSLSDMNTPVLVSRIDSCASRKILEGIVPDE